MSVRQRCQAVADDQKLGQVQSVHRGRRFDPVVMAGEAKRWWPYEVLGVLLLGLTLGWLAVVLLIVLAAGVLWAVAFLAPVEDARGRLWIALCDNGLVTARAHEDPAAIRWKDVDLTLHWPALTRLQFEDPLQFHEVRYPERYEIIGRTTGGDEITVRVSQFTRQRRLIGAVERQTSPVVLTRTRRQLVADGEVAFGPVVLRQGGDLLVHEADREHKIPAWHIDWAGSLRNTYQSIVDASCSSGAPGLLPATPRIPVNTALVRLGKLALSGNADAGA